MTNPFGCKVIFVKNLVMKIVTWMSILVLLMACNNSGKEHGGTAKTHANSLMDEVMQGHNLGMAKMSKVSEAQKKVQQNIDSIEKLPAAIQKNGVPYKIHLDSVLSRLKFADYAMNKWMEEFNMDSSLNDEAKRIEYLESEKIKIAKVNDAMIGSLSEADSVLAKNKH
jgi:hypothetical protein